MSRLEVSSLAHYRRGWPQLADPLVLPNHASNTLYPGKAEDLSKAIVGIEIEVEGLADYVKPLSCWEVKVDGSLRNNGREFVSIPLRCWELGYAFQELSEWMIYHEAISTRNRYDFSWRTSTHVHLNVRPLKVYQVAVLGVLEILYSKCFFSFIGNDRERSNFCVPNMIRSAPRQLIQFMLMTHESMGSERMKTGVPRQNNGEYVSAFINNTSKYSSLNFIPIISLGTVEYRQFHGVDDLEKLFQWLRLIIRMYDFVESLETGKEDFEDVIKSIRQLNTVSNYMEFTDRVFTPDLSHHLIDESAPDFERYMKIGCYRAKQTIFDSKESKTQTLSPASFKGVATFLEEKQKAALASQKEGLAPIKKFARAIVPQINWGEPPMIAPNPNQGVDPQQRDPWVPRETFEYYLDMEASELVRKTMFENPLEGEPESRVLSFFPDEADILEEGVALSDDSLCLLREDLMIRKALWQRYPLRQMTGMNSRRFFEAREKTIAALQQTYVVLAEHRDAYVRLFGQHPLGARRLTSQLLAVTELKADLQEEAELFLKYIRRYPEMFLQAQ
jgi:hypothetical protein